MGLLHLCGIAVLRFGELIVTLICVEAVMSWFAPSFSGTLLKIYGWIQTLTEPFVRPFRAITMRFAYTTGIDFSPLVAILAIQFASRIIASVLLHM